MDQMFSWMLMDYYIDLRERQRDCWRMERRHMRGNSLSLCGLCLQRVVALEMMDVKERWDGRRERERHKEKEICELAGVIVCVSNMSMSAEQ